MPILHASVFGALLALDTPSCPEGQRPYSGGCADAETRLGAVCFARPGRFVGAGVNLRIWEPDPGPLEGAPPRLMGDSELDPAELAHLASGNRFCFLTTEGVHGYAATPLLQKGMGAFVPIATLITNPRVPVDRLSVRVYPERVTVVLADLGTGTTSGGTPKLSASTVALFDELLFDAEAAKRLAPWLVPVPELEAWIQATRADDEAGED